MACHLQQKNIVSCTFLQLVKTQIIMEVKLMLRVSRENLFYNLVNKTHLGRGGLEIELTF